MRSMTRVRRSVGAVMATVVLVGVSGMSAQALGETSWWDCWGSYRGKSWESAINGAVHAQTVSSGECGYVYVALNTHGVLRKGTPRSSKQGSISTTYSEGANYPTGGTHKSRSNGGVFLT